MISTHTKAAITALLAVDTAATDEERTAIAATLSGQWRTLTIKDAAKRIGCQRPKLYKLIKEGLLATTPDGKVPELEISRFLATGIKAGRGCAA